MPKGNLRNQEENMSREVNMRRQDSVTKSKEKNRACDMRDDDTISTDPFGSWTGVSSFDEFDKPIQDADDL